MRKLNKADLNILRIIRSNKTPTSVSYIRKGTEYTIDELQASFTKLKEHNKIKISEGASELSYEAVK